MSKIVKKPHLIEVALNLWNKIQSRLNGYVHQSRENMITGKTVLFDGYVSSAPLLALDNPRATYVMDNNTSYFVCTHLRIRANQKVGQIMIGVNNSKNAGEIVTGVNIGAIKVSNKEVLDFVILNGNGVVQDNLNRSLDCEKVIIVDVNFAWTEDVYLIVGAHGGLWGPRDNIYGGKAMGGGTLPSVGSRLTLNTGNYVGKVVVYGDIVALRDLGIGNGNRISSYANVHKLGEFKTLAYDAGESIEIGGHTWLRCDGQTITKSLLNIEIESLSVNDITITLPSIQNGEYKYICIK